MNRPNRKEYIVKEKPLPCPECPFFKTCKSPCDVVERWLSQDYVGRVDTILLENKGGVGKNNTSWKEAGSWLDLIGFQEGLPKSLTEKDSDLSERSWLEVVEMRLTSKYTRLIFSKYKLGKRIRDIAIDEGVTSQAIDQRHKMSKKAIRKRIDAREVWESEIKKMTFNSVREYDIARMFFRHYYTAKDIHKFLRIKNDIPSKVVRKIRESLPKGSND